MERAPHATQRELRLGDGSRVAVVGGGPAGAFFTYFLLDGARRLGRNVEVDVFEPRDFSAPGPVSCNMCGGIVSESLLQKLAAEGILLPSEVIESRLDSYVLHMDAGSIRIRTPRAERRIAAVYRGAGPHGIDREAGSSFDRHLLELALARGARQRLARAEDVCLDDGRPRLAASGGFERSYDLLVVATGVNSPFRRRLTKVGIGYREPRTCKAYISEFVLGRDLVKRYLGSSMHVFMLPIPELEFAAIIPKREHATLCLLGRSLGPALVDRFLDAPEVRRCLPPLWRVPERFCRCSPRINVGAADTPFADRLVLVGDCAVTRLYKDGIGAAYRTAKAAATTVLYQGFSAAALRRGYWPACRAIERDNRFGRLLFGFTRQVRRWPSARRALWRTVSREQSGAAGRRRMSSVLWDTFTGSAPYRSVLRRCAHPSVAARLAAETARAAGAALGLAKKGGSKMPRNGTLGKRFGDGEVVYGQGEQRDAIYVVQSGEIEIVRREGNKEFCLEVLGEGDFFGEMALFESDQRSATARALGETWVLTLEKEGLLHDMQNDPSLALRILEKLARRIRERESSLVKIGALRMPF